MKNWNNKNILHFLFFTFTLLAEAQIMGNLALLLIM